MLLERTKKGTKSSREVKEGFRERVNFQLALRLNKVSCVRSEGRILLYTGPGHNKNTWCVCGPEQLRVGLQVGGKRG